MKKEIREIKLVNGEKIIRITTPDERWYIKSITDGKTGLPEYKFHPSSTWIKSYYYMSPYLVKWIAEHGLTEAEAIKKEAGLKGDKIHQASEDIDRGIEIDIQKTKYLNKETGEMEELTAEELEAVMSYRDWVDKEQPELLANEMTVFSPEGADELYAGTLDRIIALKDGDKRQIWIIDIKSSQSVWKDMLIQVSSYSHGEIDYSKMGINDEEWAARKLAILQVGYRRNKNNYKFTEIPDRYDLFKLAYQTFLEENPNAKPKQKDFPLIIKSQFRTKEVEKETKPTKKKGTK